MNSIRAARPRRSAMLRPDNRISPALGVSSPSIMRASVVLPEPDSPTMVNTSGCPFLDREAGVRHLPRRSAGRGRHPWRTAWKPGRPPGSRSLPPPPSSRRAPARAAPPRHCASTPSDGRRRPSRGAAPRSGTCRWRAGSAGGSGSRPAGRTDSAGAPPSAGFRVAVADAWQAGHQVRRVGVPGLGEQGARGALLDDAPGIHDADAVGHVRVHAHVVRHEHHRRLQRPANVIQQRQHVLLHYHVERGGGLVGDDEAGAGTRWPAQMVTRCRMPPDSSCG